MMKLKTAMRCRGASSLVLRHSFVICHSDFVIFLDGFIRHFLPDRRGRFNPGRGACAQDGISRVRTDVCGGPVSVWFFWIWPTRFPTRHLVHDIARLATELHDGCRWFEPDNGAACYNHYTRGGFGRRRDRRSEEHTSEIQSQSKLL